MENYWSGISPSRVVKQSTDNYSTLALTPEGLAGLKLRTKVTLTRPVAALEPQAYRVGEISCEKRSSSA